MPTTTAGKVSLMTAHSIDDHVADYIAECSALTAYAFDHLRSLRIDETEDSSLYSDIAVSFGRLAETLSD
ncbi:hypothetical protein BASA50_002069 [Batrachochytrium salamandrivorans]|uniref:Uncharacterized protein n=1 Tax=Batrachochytrium salamandrivorans TaxID=1357716 RepID=A0ABQ8FMU8_9FUNG|nr:hypothetical protein BASA62_006977 [Batrachochytrium salamandrivorans]KAH6580456.1 hypothetical protein BASA60_002853 [Batrachochytrium salamandrivorans]KAH6599516.1 hypothetical protein BASA61_002532 [Batrachochytrium salamandrivorans]KAH6600685.1 hypothetical protein BASA50_002069 [Batrachochytrium salamandrivorans]KAH9271657.1 hypothetical protein BASA83_006025 [Batrachochytrium salamandrivorans]